MIGPRLEWHLPEPFLDPPAFAAFGRPIRTLLARRGFRDDAQLAAFLNAGSEALHDVSLMADADVALARLERALDGGERIAIWGDYDADGMTAVVVWAIALRALGAEAIRHVPSRLADGMTAVVVWAIALRALGAEAIRHVPSRLADGYGLSNAGLERLAAASVSLIVTCDCGIANAAEVEHARTLGMDVIVTDHHLPAGELPRAVAVVDPHRPDCNYPDPDLTGAGLAYKLASALLARRGAVAADLAAMAAIGTIADLAPMTGESRAIVRLGEAELASTQRAGLRALLARACESSEGVTARDLAFGLAPRINAAGRIADADLAIALLLEEDPAAAERVAEELEAVHRQRRELTTSAVAEAREMVAGLDGSGPIALRHDAWAPGIVGLVAGRLADDLERPVAVAAPAGDELRGSVRGPVDFHAAAALEACAALLTKRGGHAAAGGFSVTPAGWEAFSAAFQALPRPYPPSVAEVAPAGRITIDLVLPAAHLGWELADQIGRLAPFGPGHAEPILAVTGLRVGDARRVGADGRHLSLRMLRGTETFDAIGFRMPEGRPLPEEGSLVDVVGTLERDTFQGEPRLRLRIIDYSASGLSPLAERRASHATMLAPAAIGAPASAAG